MKHLESVSKAPLLAQSNIPTSVLISFKQDLLQAMETLFQAKEAAQATVGQ